MKKLFAFLLVLSLVCCACAALADTDKEIQFADHTFGETLDQGLATGVVRSIDLNRVPNTPRILVDPIANWNSYAIYGFGNTVTFQIGWEVRESKSVGGHESYSYTYYYYPTKEDAAALNLRSGIFYAGYYGFYDNGNAKDTYNDLRTKLATVYGRRRDLRRTDYVRKQKRRRHQQHDGRSKTADSGGQHSCLEIQREQCDGGPGLFQPERLGADRNLLYRPGRGSEDA